MNDDILDQLKDLHIDFESITDEATRVSVALLLNIVERLAKATQELKEENQQLKDDISRLKGEQGRPTIRPQKKKSGDISSEKERKGDSSPKGKRPKKNGNLEVHRREICPVKREDLPADAQFKGYETVMVQDVVIRPENVLFEREIYYSPSLGKRITGHVPAGYEGAFGPGIKALILCLYNDAGMTQPNIQTLLKTMGIDISKALIGRWVVHGATPFHEEKVAIFETGLQSTTYQHVDDTSARVNGANHYVHIFCNPFYTAYFTCPKKDRLTLLEILNRQPLSYQLDTMALSWLESLGLSKKQRDRLVPLLTDQVMDRAAMDKVLSSLFPNPKKHGGTQRRILEACALSAFHQQDRLFQILVCDDAPQFKELTELLSLCWVHEGRHYKKLKPVLDYHQWHVDQVLKDFWSFYHELNAFKSNPIPAEKERLIRKFDEIFQRKTHYDDLDDRLQKTFAKKANLLLVLDYPEIPLHNNPAELGARVQARMRDIRLQTRNERGTQAKDTMMTLAETARKLKVNFFKYLYDRITRTFEMRSLASLITMRASGLVYDAG